MAIVTVMLLSLLAQAPLPLKSLTPFEGTWRLELGRGGGTTAVAAGREIAISIAGDRITIVQTQTPKPYPVTLTVGGDLRPAVIPPSITDREPIGIQCQVSVADGKLTIRIRRELTNLRTGAPTRRDLLEILSLENGKLVIERRDHPEAPVKGARIERDYYVKVKYLERTSNLTMHVAPEPRAAPGR